VSDPFPPVPGTGTAPFPPPEAVLPGAVLAAGARLVSAGLLPADVLEERPGVHALCLPAKENAAVRVLRAGDSLEVGRAPAEGRPGWAVPDPWMSARHFLLSVSPSGVPALEALAAKNGLFVNDRPAGEGKVPLRRGDAIRAGTTCFLLL